MALCVPTGRNLQQEGLLYDPVESYFTWTRIADARRGRERIVGPKRER